MTTKTRRRGAVGLGRRQKMVLWMLADESKTVRHMEYDRFPGMDEAAIRGAITGLEKRGLVDVVDRDFRTDDRGLRVYGLTERGRRVVEQITTDREDED